MRKEKTIKKRVLAWMLALSMGLSIAPTTAFAAEMAEDETAIGDENESVLSEELQALQERINALPTGDEYREMSAEEQDAVYETAASVSDNDLEMR